MKKSILIKLSLCLLICINFSAFSQINVPDISQKAKVMQRVGTTDIAIKYSRPRVNGREIWGTIVPYGMNNLGFGTATEAPWRAGADENTIIYFSHDVKVEGKPVKAGKYGFHVELKPDNKATIILSHDKDSWGSFFYDESKDALRAEITTNSVPHRELLTYEFNTVTPNSAIVSLVWEKKEIPFKIEVDVTKIVLDEFREKAKGELGFNRQNWEQAATFALNNGGDLNEALAWVDKAIEGQFFSQKTFNNLTLKGRILYKMGKTEESKKYINEAASMANMNQLNNLGYQLLNEKDYDLALKFFKKNVADNPTNANVHDSLGECYKIMGDKKNAIKYLKKSLSLNPPANVKANSEKLLKELGVM